MGPYPLKFRPRYVEKIWGGRRLHTVLGKTDLPPEKPIGESWDLYDFPPGVVDKSGDWVSSVIANGPHAGRTLHWAVGEFGPDLYGDVPLCGEGAGAGQFPILIKFLDAREDLSVQVHPPQVYCDSHPGAHLKCEAWYVLRHDPGARLLKGLRPGTTREAFKAAIERGTVEQLIEAIPAKDGQCHYLPSGTVHALGAGILVAEVQTPSDTTFRVFDFNRVEPATGKPRTLHVEQALDCIDFSETAAGSAGSNPPAAEKSLEKDRLVACDYFKMGKARLAGGVERPVASGQPVVWMMLQGRAQVRADGLAEPTEISPGETVLLPATLRSSMVRAVSDCAWLEVTLPSRSRGR